jgi:hypothetical protein
VVRAISLSILLHKYKDKATALEKYETMSISYLSSHLSITALLKRWAHRTDQRSKNSSEKGRKSVIPSIALLPLPNATVRRENVEKGSKCAFFETCA